ncbi:MAG: UTP--glucose-1-phosphate uridylyltransferase [Paracoccaceae bacterium]|nr:UTP--glucose-1-phosphate uridylyltransferase [Paracoccaceae bacterium]
MLKMARRRVRKAVFPVAGLGSRLLPATRAVPKEMLTVVNRPLIQHAVDEAAQAGIEQFVFVTGRAKQAIENHFDLAYEFKGSLEGKDRWAVDSERVRGTVPAPGDLISVRQPEPLGLGHAVWCARHAVGDEPFAVLLPDDLVLGRVPCIGELLEQHYETGGNVLAVQEVPRPLTSRYGVIDCDGSDSTVIEIRGLVEKPDPVRAPSTLAVVGRYVLLPEVFDQLQRVAAVVKGEVQLTDALMGMIGHGPFHGVRVSGTRFDCGTKLGILQANLALGLNDPDVGDELAAFARAWLDGRG